MVLSVEEQCGNSGGPSLGRSVIEMILTSCTWFDEVAAEKPPPGPEIWNPGLGEARVKVSTSWLRRRDAGPSREAEYSESSGLSREAQSWSLNFV